MLHTNPLPQKPPPRWLKVATAVLTALADIVAGVALAFVYDAGLVVVYVLLLLTQGRHSKNPSLEGGTLVFSIGAVLGVLLALGFVVKGYYWRALGVVPGLIPLIWFAQHV